MKLPVTSLIFALSFHYAYVAYINPAFGYAAYDYFPPSVWMVIITYALIAAPLVLYRESTAPASYGASLIFALCYVPAQLVVLFTWPRGPQELLLVQGSLAASMAALLVVSTKGRQRTGSRVDSASRLKHIVAVLTVITLAMLIAVYHDHMRLVSFSDVYDLRFETAEIETNAFVDYPMLWLSYSFLPYFMARGILQKSAASIGWALFGSLLIYSTTGSKASLLMPAIILALFWVMKLGRQFLFTVLVSLTVTILLIITLIPDEGVLLWIKSIIMVRILGTGGWNVAKYYEYFTTNGFTYYTHIGPVNALTGAYPYGENSLGQLIGLEYTGSTEANFNANFWASDAFAALGVAGVPVVTFALCTVFYVINRLTSGYSPRFVTLWLAGFWLAMMNLPLTTALLSGGGGMTLLLLWTSRRRRPSDAPSPRGQPPPGIPALSSNPAP